MASKPDWGVISKPGYFYQEARFWKVLSLVLAGLVIGTQLVPVLPHWLPRDGEKVFPSPALVKPVQAAAIYPEFTCPCCGRPLDKENPCCGAMTKMIDFIDQQAGLGLSEEEIYLATVREFGIERLTSKEKQEEIKQVLAARAPADAAKISFATDLKDLGELSRRQGEVFSDFEFTNKGQTELEINKLGSSCGCTSAAIIYQGKEGPRFTMAGHGKENPTDWQVAIAPQDKAILRVYYDPSVHQDLTGPVTRTVSVFSNDPVEFEKKVTITLDQIP